MKIELAYLGKVSLAFALATIILTIVVILANAEEMDLTRAVIHHSASKGAHAKGRNNLVGICLTGYDRFTTAQIESLRGLLKRLGIVEIEPHHEKCPGKGLNLEQIQKEIE